MSLNWRSELWKIDKNSGDVVYRVGPNGDVQLATQHYASGMHSVVPIQPNKVLLLDNGINKNITRAMVYSINPDSKVTNVELNVALSPEYFSPFMSNAQIIAEDLIMFGSAIAYTIIFTKQDGTVPKTLKTAESSYRSVYFSEIQY